MPDDTKINWPRARPCHQFGEPHPNDFAGGITGCGRCGREENEHPEHRKYDPPFSTNPAHRRSLMERFGGQGREVESELTLEERVKWLEKRVAKLFSALGHIQG